MPKGIYERKQRDFICNRCSKSYKAMTQRKGKGFCRNCRMVLKTNRKRKRVPHWTKKYRRKGRLKQILAVGNKCKICRLPVILDEEKWEFNSKFVIHHINYKKETTVLLCYPCHCWLHGNSPVWRHPFKEKYTPDEAAFIFASKVVELYLKHDPRMDEIVKVNIKTLEEIK